jgi:hypothetical protein
MASYDMMYCIPIYLKKTRGTGFVSDFVYLGSGPEQEKNLVRTGSGLGSAAEKKAQWEGIEGKYIYILRGRGSK